MEGWHIFFFPDPVNSSPTTNCWLLFGSAIASTLLMSTRPKAKGSLSRKKHIISLDSPSIQQSSVADTKRALQTYPCHRQVSSVILLRYTSVVWGYTLRTGNATKFIISCPLGNRVESQAPSTHHRNENWARKTGCWAMRDAGMNTWRSGSSDCWVAVLCLLIPL